jgi:hypothetical protein
MCVVPMMGSPPIPPGWRNRGRAVRRSSDRSGVGLGEQSDGALADDVGRRDAYQRFAGSDEAGAVPANDAGDLVAVGVDRGLGQRPEFGGVLDQDAFGDDDDETDACFDGFDDGALGEGRRNEDDGDLGSGLCQLTAP